MTRASARWVARRCRCISLLGQLYDAAQAGHPGVTAKRLAVRLDMDPTTLSRTLRPLRTKGLIRLAADLEDGQVRLVGITAAGRQKLQRAIPAWRRAQQRLAETLGGATVAGLGKTLDRSLARLAA